MKAILEVVKFSIDDVITASGAPACPTDTGSNCDIPEAGI